MLPRTLLFRTTCRRSCHLRGFAANAQSIIVPTAAYQPNIEDIKKLRVASEAPVKDCKKALIHAEGDFPTAFEWLRKKGIASATAKAGRSAAEGLVGVHVCPQSKVAGIVEVNCETDFVALNERFQQLVKDVATRVIHWDGLSSSSLSSLSSLSSSSSVSTESSSTRLLHLPVGENKLLSDLIPELIGKVGENVVPRRASVLRASGVVCDYVHNTVQPGIGKLAAVVALDVNESSSGVTTHHDDNMLEEIIKPVGRRLAMHIVAAHPRYLSRQDVPASVVQHERDILMEQAATSGKPAHILEKMIDGRMNKFYNDVVLLEQNHLVEEGNPIVQKILQDLQQQHGIQVSVTGFMRYQVGEMMEN